MRVSRLKRETYRHIEAELEDYALTRQMIAETRADAVHGAAQRDDLGVRVMSGGPSNMTASRATQLAADRTLQTAETIIDAIERVWSSMDEDCRTVAYVQYCLTVGDWRPPADVCERLAGACRSCGRPQLRRADLVDVTGLPESVYYRYRTAIVLNVARLLGWF